MSILKAVLIVDHGIKSEIPDENWNKFIKLYSKKGYLILGDGIDEPISRLDLSILKGVIDYNTRIDILDPSFGNIIGDFYDKLLGDIGNVDCCSINLWCDYGKDLREDFLPKLPSNSMLTVHVAYETMVIPIAIASLEAAITKLQSQEAKVSPYQSFIDNIATATVQNSISFCKVNNVVYSFEVRPTVENILQNTKRYLTNRVNKFKKFYQKMREHSILTGDVNNYFLEEDLSFNGFTEEEIEFYQLASFLNFCCYKYRDLFVSTKLSVRFRGSKLANREFIKGIIDKDINSMTPLFAACIGGTEDVVELLLDLGADSNKCSNKVTPLYMASSKGYSDIVLLLLEKGALPNNGDSYGETPLAVAARKACFGYDDCVGVISTLLLYGADINHQDEYGNTALLNATWAYWEGNDDCLFTMALLLRHGANPNLFATERITSPLHILAYGALSFVEGVELLLKYGANPNQEDTQGNTPFHIAYKGPGPKIAPLFLKYGADPHKKTKDGLTARDLAKNSGWDVDKII